MCTAQNILKVNSANVEVIRTAARRIAADYSKVKRTERFDFNDGSAIIIKGSHVEAVRNGV